MATETEMGIVREDPGIEKIRMQLLEAAKAQAGSRMRLPNFQVAGFTPEQVQALQMGVQGIGAYKPSLAQGTATVGRAADIVRGPAMDAMQRGIGTLEGTMGMYDPNMGQAFMNPYQQQVIDESLRQIQRQGDISRQNLQAQAVRAGAFGGSREGVQRAELDRGLAAQQNAAILSGLQQGYGQSQQQAQSAFEAQQARQQGAAGLFGQFGQGIGSLGTQLSSIGGQQAGLGQLAQQLSQQDTNFLFNLGQQQQRQSQTVLDAQRANAQQAAQQPFQNIAFLSDIYRGAPSTQMSMTQRAVPTPSAFQQMAGLTAGTIGTLGAANQAGLI
jgi:hypothetical protein